MEPEKTLLTPKGATMLVKVTRMDNGASEVINLTEVSTVQPVPPVAAEPAFDGSPAMPARAAIPGRPSRAAVPGVSATANSPAVPALPAVPEVPDVPAMPAQPAIAAHPAIPATPESSKIIFSTGRDPLHVKETVDVILGK